MLRAEPIEIDVTEFLASANSAKDLARDAFLEMKSVYQDLMENGDMPEKAMADFALEIRRTEKLISHGLYRDAYVGIVAAVNRLDAGNEATFQVTADASVLHEADVSPDLYEMDMTVH